MKILIVNTNDSFGGAARAAFRLHRALLMEGVESRMLVQDKRSDDYTIEWVGATKVDKAMALIRPAIDGLPVQLYKKRSKSLFSPAWLYSRKTVQRINCIQPDITHLHWINGGMLRIEDLSRIKSPIVWSLHDMWAFTGGCHYNKDCNKYLKICGACKELNSTNNKDLSYKIFVRKQKAYPLINQIYFNSLSGWLHNKAKASYLLNSQHHTNLPNPIDASEFKPFDRNEARKLWNLPKNKKFILFGAINPLSDSRKGFNQLFESLSELENHRKDIELLIFGSSQSNNHSWDFRFKTHYLGHLQDNISLTTLYNAADIMVVPSLQENLSNAIMESLSCGTPVACFNIGGNSDMVEHRGNGYLAKPFSAKDLAKGIEWVLDHPNYNELRKRARTKIEREFDSRIVASKYIELYKEILSSPPLP